jgi:hypothetical protein
MKWEVLTQDDWRIDGNGWGARVWRYRRKVCITTWGGGRKWYVGGKHRTIPGAKCAATRWLKPHIAEHTARLLEGM